MNSDIGHSITKVLLSSLNQLRQQLNQNDCRIRHAFLRRVEIPNPEFDNLPIEHFGDRLCGDRFESVRLSQTQWHGEKFHLCPKCNERNSIGPMRCRKCETEFPVVWISGDFVPLESNAPATKDEISALRKIPETLHQFPALPVLHDELRSYFLLDSGVSDTSFRDWHDTLFELDRIVTQADTTILKELGTARWWPEYLYQMAVISNSEISNLAGLSFKPASDSLAPLHLSATDQFACSMLPLSSLPPGEHFVFLTDDIRKCSVKAIELLLQKDEKPTDCVENRRKAGCRRKSTAPGEAREKLRAGLLAHHKYDNGSIGNYEPVGNNELARSCAVTPAAASDFFKSQFEGHRAYQNACVGKGNLIAALKLMSGEILPKHLLTGADQRVADQATQVAADSE